MADRHSIKITGLGDAITQELTMYHQDVTDQVDKISEASIKQLAKLTRATAPKGARGEYRKSIASKLLVKRSTGSTYVWYVKAPNHRLTHLLVHPHATKNGGRTKADPFLQNAVDEVLPEYEAAIERTLKNGK
jgi:hypothetical protein